MLRDQQTEPPHWEGGQLRVSVGRSTKNGDEVGTVSAVSEPPERLLKNVALAPFVAFHQLEEVFVMAPVHTRGGSLLDTTWRGDSSR